MVFYLIAWWLGGGSDLQGPFHNELDLKLARQLLLRDNPADLRVLKLTAPTAAITRGFIQCGLRLSMGEIDDECTGGLDGGDGSLPITRVG